MLKRRALITIDQSITPTLKGRGFYRMGQYEGVITVKLKDFADMADYLENRCYCPYEIYDTSGFFFQFFKPETSCEHLASGEKGSIHGDFVIARQDDNSMPQIIYIEHTNGIVDDCVRIDATEHNIREVKSFMAGDIEKMNFDEFGNTAEDLARIFELCSGVCVS